MKSTEIGDVTTFTGALVAGGSITAINYKNENIIHAASWNGRVNIFQSVLENDANQAHI
jgi:hypothetical protein